MYVNGMIEQMEKNIGDRLRDARVSAGFSSMAKAADRVGKTASTYRAHENGQNEYDHTDAELYASAFGVSAEWLLFGGNSSYAEWRLKTQKDEVLLPTGAAVDLPIVGDVAAGLWAEANLFESDLVTADNEELSSIAPNASYPVDAQFVVRVRGHSLNKIAGDGDLLLCVDYLAAALAPRNNDVALIERSRDSGMTIERTAKRIVIIDGQIELMPESTDPKFQNKIVYREGDEEHTEVKIKAKIVMAFKPL